MNDILNKMDADELRNLAKHQEEAIKAYQEMVFTKDKVIGVLETLYRSRIDMEEARVRYEVAIANLRYHDDRIYDKYDDPHVCVNENYVSAMETDEREMAIREAVNTIQWVQEYIQAIGEENKDVYVEGLEKAMKLLMGKKTMNFDGEDQPCPPPPRGEWRKFTDAHGNIIGSKNTAKEE